MSEQLALDGSSRIIGLTPRQTAALRWLEATGGCTLTELGAQMHARRGKHRADLPCTYCNEEGASVLHELKRKNLVRREQGGVWRSTRPLSEDDGRGEGRPSSSLSGPVLSTPTETREGAAPTSQSDWIPF